MALEVLIPPLLIRIKTGPGLMFGPYRDYPSANRANPHAEKRGRVMRLVLKRISLGLLLIMFASGILLVSDWDRRTPRNREPAAVSTDRLSSDGLTKKWQLHLIEFSNMAEVEEAEDGLLTGLRESGLLEGRDYEVTIRNAQGDMGTLNSLVDAALTEGADLLIPLSTVALQVTVNRVHDLPIVFTLVANGVVAGAGRSNEDHLPNVTGVFHGSGYDEVMALVREILPAARTVGTLFSSSEANSVFHKENLVKAAQRIGLEVVALPVSVSTEIADAALALMSRKIDVVCQVGSSVIVPGFPSIVQAAERAKLPIFGFQSSFVQAGAVVVLTRDFWDAGREAGDLVVRVMRGESPAAIPFQPVKKTKLIVNLAAAGRSGLTLPTAVIKRADQVIQ